MRYWIYKCNLKPVNGPDAGDWEDWIFAPGANNRWRYPEGVRWGRYRNHPELAELRKGDRVIALQTGSRQVLVGLAEFVGDAGRGMDRSVKLRPVELIRVKIPPLKKQDPRGVGRIDALQGGKIQTLYDITTKDAKLLIDAARRARDKASDARAAEAAARHTATIDKVTNRGAGFGDAETNRKVERAAVRTVTTQLTADGWRVTSVEATKVGYDLRCTRGKDEQYVEVKGVQGAHPTFFITAAEARFWERHRRHARIAVVTSALTKPSIRWFTPARAELLFEPVLYRGSVK